MAKSKKNSGTTEATEDEARPQDEMTETELVSIVDAAINNSLGKMDTRLSNDRLQAMKYYLGDKTGNLAPPEAEGRSSVVSMDVADTIEWILPTLIRMFTAGDQAVEYTARSEAAVPFAEQATNWANYVFYTQNEGFIIIHDWFKDALLQKLGIVKTWWDDSKDITTEEYEGLTLEEITIMMQDGTVEVIQKTERMPDEIMGQPVQEGMPVALVYDIKVKRTANSSHICIENVPPEEFLFSRKARSATRIFDCHHRIERTVTELKKAGYKNTDTLMSDDCGAEFSQEAIERQSDTNEFTYGALGGDSADKTMRLVWITESNMQVDWNGDGLAEWRKIVKSGKVLLSNEEIDEHPFSLITPIKMPHKLVGRSIADLVMDLQDIKTALRRQIIDNMYLRNNPRQYVDTTKGVNIDDLLDSRVGGIVRGKGENGVTPLLTQDLSPLTFQLLEDLDRTLQARTGVSAQSQGIDVNAINKTATESNNLLNSAMQRIELIARVFAETGVKDLFKKILKLSGKYQKQAQTIRLTGNKFVQIDPRAWKTQYDIMINVGLGNGNVDQMAGRLMNIMSIQEKALEGGLPITGAKQIYNAAKKLVISSGFKSADAFFIDPESDEGQKLAQAAAQKPNPEMMKMQAEMQMKQTEMQMKQQDAATQNQVQKANDDRDYQRQQAKDQNDFQLELAKIEAQKQSKLQELQFKSDLELKKHAMSLEAQSKPATTIQVDSQGALDNVVQTLSHAAEGLHNLTQMAAVNHDTHNEAMVHALNTLATSHATKKAVKVTRAKDGSLVGEVG